MIREEERGLFTPWSISIPKHRQVMPQYSLGQAIQMVFSYMHFIQNHSYMNILRNLGASHMLFQGKKILQTQKESVIIMYYDDTIWSIKSIQINYELC